jgi:hypothetical protein
VRTVAREIGLMIRSGSPFEFLARLVTARRNAHPSPHREHQRGNLKCLERTRRIVFDYVLGQQGTGSMKSTARILIALALVCAFTSSSPAGTATGTSKAKAMKTSACKKEARAKKFGTHVLERRTFLKECMARPA